MKLTLHKSADQVREARAAQYPAIGDQLDAVFRLAEALRAAGMALPPDTLAWIDTLNAVKTANPK